MEHYSHDVVKRMREIKRVLDGGAIASTAVPDGGDGGGGEEVATQPAPRPPAGSSTATDTPPPPPDDPHAVPATDTARVALLDELVEIVESIDHARDLALIGGLPTLLALLASPAAPLRARAAEVLGTAAQSNPPVQDWFLEGGVLPAVLGMLAGGGGGGAGGRGGGGGDPCPLARQKALFALSCLVRHCDRATDALLAGGGVPVLVAEASGEAAAGRPGAARKAWQLLSYLAAAGRPGVDVPSSAAGAGVGAALVTALALPDGDGEVRGAAVGCAAALARAGGAGAAALGKDESVLCALRSLAGAEGGEGATGAGEALVALEAASASGGGGGGGGGSGGAVMVV